MQGRVLIVAGSDSGGGAGIQADLKTVTAFGVYGSTAIAALTVQNTLGVFGVLPIEASFVREQMEAVLDDIGTDVIKTGMLHDAQVIRMVAAVCRGKASGIPVVVDPVLVAKGGARLLERSAERALVEDLVPLAAVLTPNAPEAEALTGLSVRKPADMGAAADRLLAMGAGAVLLKGGHLEGDTVIDLLRTADGAEVRFESPRLTTRSTHGTGCTLASAIAAGLAEGRTLEHAVARAREYVAEAMRTAPGLGQGHGPLNHAHRLEKQEDGPEPYTIH